MSSFQAVNTTLTVPEPPPGRSGEETTPNTPRPDARFQKDSRNAEDMKHEDPSLKTPTRNSFVGIPGQRPLPSSPFEPTRELSETPSTKSNLTSAGTGCGAASRRGCRCLQGKLRGSCPQTQPSDPSLRARQMVSSALDRQGRLAEAFPRCILREADALSPQTTCMQSVHQGAGDVAGGAYPLPYAPRGYSLGSSAAAWRVCRRFVRWVASMDCSL